MYLGDSDWTWKTGRSAGRVGMIGRRSPGATARSTRPCVPDGGLDTLSRRPEETGRAAWIEGLSRDVDCELVRACPATCTGPRLACPERVASGAEGPMEAMLPGPEEVVCGTSEVTWLGAVVLPSPEGVMADVLPPEAVLPPVRSVTPERVERVR